MSDGWGIIVGVLVGYVIGMFPSADLVAWVASRGSVDLRSSGSGNPGGLNAARVLGKKWGLVVIVLDAAKGALAGFLGLAIGDAAAYAAGTAVIAGHCWPVWNGFRGGKGVAAAGGSFFAVFPPMVAVDGLITAPVVVGGAAARGWRSRSRSWCGSSSAGVWWAADLSMGWGPDAGPGLLVYAALGAGMIQARFVMTARAGGPSL